MIANHKIVLLILSVGVHLELNRLLVLCDDWILKFKDDFNDNKIHRSHWKIHSSSTGKKNEV